MPTCGEDDPTAPAAAYSYEPEPRFALFAGVSGIDSIIPGTRSSVPASRLTTAGAHQFRHGLATEMLRQGASLSEIGRLARVITIHRPR